MFRGPEILLKAASPAVPCNECLEEHYLIYIFIAGEPTEDDSINVLGLVSIIVFYLIVLAIGVWAGWNQKRKQTQADDQETVMLAGRNIGLLVGVMTMGGKSFFF